MRGRNFSNLALGVVAVCSCLVIYNLSQRETQYWMMERTKKGLVQREQYTSWVPSVKASPYNKNSSLSRRNKQFLTMEDPTIKGVVQRQQHTSRKSSVKTSPHNKNSNCDQKSLQMTQVYTRDAKSWRQNKDICSECLTFPNTTLKTPFGNTPIFIYEGGNDVLVSEEIRSKGMFESSEAKFMYKKLREDPEINLLDIGANLGVYTLSAAKLGRKVLAVEALDRNLQHICASVAAGQLQNSIYLVHNAISNGNSLVDLGIDKSNMGGTFVDVDADHIKELKLGRAQGTYGKVYTITMDDLLDLPIIDKFQKVFIKMDIEGFEARALEKANRLFQKLDIVAFVMEWDFHRGTKTAFRILNFMKEKKYKPYSVDAYPTPLDVTISSQWPYDVLWLPDHGHYLLSRFYWEQFF